MKPERIPTFDQIPQVLCELMGRIDSLTDLVRTMKDEKKESELPISRKVLCGRLGISQQTAISWTHAGKLPQLKIGGAIRYDWQAVLAALNTKNVK